MSIKVADNLNGAIVEKIQSILDNTDYIDSMYITIEGNRGEVPTIRYNIKEFITPKEAENDTWDKGKLKGDKE